MSAETPAWPAGQPKWFRTEEFGKSYMLLLDGDVQQAVVLRRDGYVSWTMDGLAGRFLEQRFPQSPDDYGPGLDNGMVRAETIGWTDWRDIWDRKDDCVELRIPGWPEGWTPEPPPPPLAKQKEALPLDESPENSKGS